MFFSIIISGCNRGNDNNESEIKECNIHYDLNHDGICDECGKTYTKEGF